MSDDLASVGPETARAGIMSIGMFSRASLLTVKALRNYHQSGLLVPAEIDPKTGYRGYHTGQLADAAVIRELRTLDLPLADIERVMAARDPDVTAAVVSAHLEAMEERLASTQAIVDRLMAGTEAPSALTPPRVIEAGHLDVVMVSGSVERERYAPFLERAFGLLFGALVTAGSTPSGPGGACYPAAVEATEEVQAFIPIDSPVNGLVHPELTIAELPARRMATATHHGSYDTVGETYMHLGRWVALNAETADEPVREHYVASPADTADPNDFVTKIHWPIKRLRADDQPETKASTP